MRIDREHESAKSEPVERRKNGAEIILPPPGNATPTIPDECPGRDSEIS